MSQGGSMTQGEGEARVLLVFAHPALERSRANRVLAATAENAPGVVSVKNHIIVRPHSWAEAKPYFAEKG